MPPNNYASPNKMDTQPATTLYPPITQVVPPLPSKYGDSTDESEPGLDYLKILRPEYRTPDDLYQAQYYSVQSNTDPTNEIKRPYAGQGKPLKDAIKDAWETWREMLFSEAQNGNTEAQIDLAMAYWRGHVNYNIEQDKDEAVQWMEQAATGGRHEISPKGGCGFENCFKCYAQNLHRRMKVWLEDEQRQKDMSVAQIVALHTPHLIFNILSYCDVETLSNLYLVNNLWHEIVSDSRAWSHINMLEHFPIPSIPNELLPQDSPVRNNNNNIDTAMEAKDDPTPEGDFDLTPKETHIKPQPFIRDSKNDITLFTQLPPLHRNICRVCEKKIEPPEDYQIEQHTVHNSVTGVTDTFYKYPQPYMVEATTIPDPFWKFFVCHRDCFYERAQGTITPYTLQGMKTVVFQGELKKEAINQIQWEKYAFRRIQVPNMNQFTLASLLPPTKPDELDDNRTWCARFRDENPELLEYIDQNGGFDLDEDDDMDDIDGDDDEDEDDGDEAYGLIDDDLDDIDVDANEDEDNELGFDIDDFLSGEKFTLLDDDDHKDNDDWKKQVSNNRALIKEYWRRNDMVKWYDKATSQYQYIANVLLAYSSGLMWSEYPNQQFYDMHVTNSTAENPKLKSLIPTSATSTPTPQELMESLKAIKPVDCSVRMALDYDYFTFPRAYPPQTKKKNGATPYSPPNGQEDGEEDKNVTIDPLDLPTIIPSLTATSPLTPNSDLQTMLQRAPNPYDVPELFNTLLQAKYPHSNFIIDNSPLWLLLTQFTQYRKYAKLFHEFDDVTVEYPTPQAYLFPHGDSRYCYDVNYSHHIYGQQGQFSPQYIIDCVDTTPNNTDQTTSEGNNPSSTAATLKPFALSLENYLTPSKPALPLVYELFQLLLRSTTGIRFLQYRELIFKQLLPRFDLRWDKPSKTIVPYPNGNIIVNANKDQYKSKGE